MVKYLGEINSDFDSVNKKYVDETLQNDFEFKVFQQTFSQSDVSSFDKYVSIEEGWTPYGFFTIGTEGAVGYGYQSYPTELTANNTVRCRGWCNVNGGQQIRIWVPCYRKRVAKNLLAYTTKDTLWSGNSTGSYTCNLSQSWKDYDYLDFKFTNGGNRIWRRIQVPSLIEMLTNGGQLLEPIGWNGEDRRLIIYKAGTTNKTLKMNLNGSIYLQEIIGYRVVPEKDLGGNVVVKQIITGRCDGSGYFKDNNSNPITLPAGKVLLSARPCTLAEGQSSSFWNVLKNSGSKVIPLYNPSDSNTNAWSILLRGWDDSNNYANITGIKMEIAYA